MQEENKDIFTNLLFKIENIKLASQEQIQKNYMYLLKELATVYNDQIVVADLSLKIVNKIGNLDLITLEPEELDFLINIFFSNYSLQNAYNDYIEPDNTIQKNYYDTVIENFEQPDQYIKNELFLVYSGILDQFNKNISLNSQLALINIDLNNLRKIISEFNSVNDSEDKNKKYTFYNNLKQLNNRLRSAN